MAFRIDNDVEFLGTIQNGGVNNLIIGQAVSVNRRTPADVMNINDTIILKLEESGQHETTLCTLISSTELVRTRVLDRWDRTGPLTTPVQSLNLQKVNFSQGSIYCAGTIPQPLNITLQPDGTFAYTDAIRASVFYTDIAAIQDPLSNIVDNEVVFAVNGLAPGDNLGGLFLYDAGGDNGTIDDVDIFDPGTVGNPRAGILIRQKIDVHAAFFREDLSLYPPTTVVRQKLFSQAFGTAGANDWMAARVQRGTDGNGAYTDYEITARDRQASEVPFARARSYGSAFDIFEFLKPIALPAVADTTAIKAGMIARSTADEKLYYNDPNRGLAQILLSDGGPRGRVATIAALRLLTPDGYQDGEVVDVTGYLFNGDGVRFSVYWDGASTAADNGYSVFKPTVHVDGASWVEAGRFLVLAPLKLQTFLDSDATVDAYTGFLWETADTPPAGGVTNIQIIPGGMVLIIPGALPCIFKHNANGSSGRLLLPNNDDLTLSPGDGTLLGYEENGAVRIISDRKQEVVMGVGDGTAVVDVARVLPSNKNRIMAHVSGTPIYPAQITSIVPNSPASGQSRITFAFNVTLSADVMIWG